MEVFVRYAVECVSYNMDFIPNFMKMGSGIEVILGLLPQNLRGFSVYWQERFMKYTNEVASGSVILIPSFVMISTGIQIMWLLPEKL